MAYLGTLGGLVRLKCAASLGTSTARPARNQTTLGGAVSVQVGPRTNRTWDVSLAAASTPADISAVRAFAEGEFGLGPWVFVSDWAPVTNMISPRGSVLDSKPVQAGTSPEGGALALPDGGVAGRSWLVTSGATIVLPWVEGLEYIPVEAGRRVTASVYMRGQGGRLRLRFYDVAGAITRTVGDAFVVGAGVERVSLSATPVTGEVKMLMLIDMTVTRIARPSITWTDVALPWSVGEGAPSVHIAAISGDLTMATSTQQYASASYQIQEVG